MNKQSAFINEESDEKIVKETEEEELKELKRKRNCERQRAYYHRQKDLKKNENKIKKKKETVPKSNAERQRKFRQRNAEKSYVNMKRQKLDSNDENVVQCRAVENIKNVTLQENQFHSQQLQIYEQRNQCITPEVILNRNTGISDDVSDLLETIQDATQNGAHVDANIQLLRDNNDEDSTEDNDNNHENEINSEDPIGENIMDFTVDGQLNEWKIPMEVDKGKPVTPSMHLQEVRETEESRGVKEEVVETEEEVMEEESWIIKEEIIEVKDECIEASVELSYIEESADVKKEDVDEKEEDSDVDEQYLEEWKECDAQWREPKKECRETLIPLPAHSAPAPAPQRPLCGNDIEKILFYGSDGDADNSEDEEEELQPIIVPRVLRPFYDIEEDSSEEDAPPLVVDDSWPPTRHPTPRDEPSAQPVPSVPPPAACFPEKFDFQWRQFPRTQIQPELRREPFSQINCGPTAQYADPYEAFIAIWDRAIMEHIVLETNKYAQQVAAAMMLQGIAPCSRITQWMDTNVDELYTYFAITLATGMVVKSRLDEYWNSSKDIFSTPEFSTAMPFDRFCLLSKCLHFNDNDLCTPEAISNNEAKLFKVLPIVQHLNNKFSELYVLGRNIALDESLTQWTGRLNIRQHIPNKAAAVGVKTYEICESETGYLWRFEVEARQSSKSTQESNPISGKIPSLVLRLLHGLEHKGYTVWMDNFYNSPALARELKLLGFDCAGTLRTNRQLVPAELTNLKSKHMAVGQVCGCTSGDVDIIVWRDKKRIALISTYHGLTTTTSHDITKPALIHDYNICMGGIDKKDQLLAMYPIERKRTKVWYKKFFQHLLNVSVLNAYILHTSNRQLSHRNFRRSLVVQLLGRHNTSHQQYAPKVSQPLESMLHVPLFFDFERAGEGLTSRRLRRKCAVCSKRCITYCGGCGGKPMCLKPCFPRYHTSLYTEI